MTVNLNTNVVIATYQSGATMRQIADTYGVSLTAVRDRLIGKVELRPRGRPPSPEKVKVRNLKPDVTPEMVAGYRAGLTLKAIAEMYGVSIGTVRNRLLYKVEFRPRGRPKAVRAKERILDIDALPEEVS